MIDFIKAAVAAILVIAGTVLLRCSERIAGAGSETTNGVVGSILNPDDTPAPNTVVKLFPDGYDPVADTGISFPLVDTTDREGTFRFKHLDTGSYSIVARDNRIAAGLLLPEVIVRSHDSVTVLPPGNLAGTGSIEADFSGSAETVSGYIYLPGTDIFSPLDNDGSAILDNVPSGTITAVIHASAGGNRRNILRNEVTVLPDSSVTIRHPAWKYARRLFLTTTPDGANVMDDLYGFPVLIRLDDLNFNFGETDPAGNDLLFTGSDDTPLPCEIERWDAAGNRAEIWLRIDTLRGNSSTQSITMYWGNPDAAIRQSPGGDVFDTGDGFQGVWHLGDAVKDSVKDATANRYHATSPDTSRPQVIEGIIGNCRLFNGRGDFITVPGSASGALDFPQNGRYTVSAWVYVESTDGLSHVIVSKGNTQYFLWHTPIHLDATLWEFADYRDGSGWDLSVSTLTTGQWVLLTGVRDGASQHLYVNGELSDTIIDYPYPFGAAARNSSFDLMIGRFAQAMPSLNNDEGFCYFEGGIDEVRICSRPLSAAWVRLCYMNQRTDDKLVVFK